MLNQKTVVLNTPKSINTDYLFQLLKLKSKYKITHVNSFHLLFTIHQINFFTKKYGWCDFDSQGYYETFGCTPNVVATILIILQEEGIIKRTRRGNNENGMVSSYVYLNPFNYANQDECDEHKFLTNYKGTPKFINVWVQNGFKIVRKPKVENKVKPIKVKQLSKAEQAKLIVDLQAEIASLKAQLSNSNTSAVEDKLIPIGSLFESVKIDNKVDDLYEYSYDNDKFLVDNWQLLVDDYIYGVDDLKENIAITMANEPFDIGDFIVKKTYNKTQNVYYVSLVN